MIKKSLLLTFALANLGAIYAINDTALSSLPAAKEEEQEVTAKLPKPSVITNTLSNFVFTAVGAAMFGALKFKKTPLIIAISILAIILPILVGWLYARHFKKAGITDKSQRPSIIMSSVINIGFEMIGFAAIATGYYGWDVDHIVSKVLYLAIAIIFGIASPILIGRFYARHFKEVDTTQKPYIPSAITHSLNNIMFTLAGIIALFSGVYRGNNEEQLKALSWLLRAIAIIGGLSAPILVGIQYARHFKKAGVTEKSQRPSSIICSINNLSFMVLGMIALIVGAIGIDMVNERKKSTPLGIFMLALSILVPLGITILVGWLYARYFRKKANQQPVGKAPAVAAKA